MAFGRQKSVVGSHLAFEALEPRLALSGTGLTAQYFHNVDFTGLAESRTEAIGHNWETARPAAGVRPRGGPVDCCV